MMQGSVLVFVENAKEPVTPVKNIPLAVSRAQYRVPVTDAHGEAGLGEKNKGPG